MNRLIHRTLLPLILGCCFLQASASVVRMGDSKKAPAVPLPSGDSLGVFDLTAPEFSVETGLTDKQKQEIQRTARDMNAFIQLRSFESALLRANRLVELSPDDNGFRMLQCWLLVQVKDYQAAEEATEDFLQKGIGLSEAQKNLLHEILGVSQLMQDKSEQALGTYQNALNFATSPVSHQIRMGWIALYQGKIQQAEQILKSVIAAEPDHPGARDLLGLCAYQAGDFARSKAEHEASLKADDEQAEVWNHLGSAQFQLGEKQEALASYRKALEIDPGLRDAHSNLGGVLADIGKTDAAFEALSTALDLQITDAQSWRNLLTLIDREYKRSTGISQAVEALRSNLDDAAAHEHLARALMSTNSIAPAYVLCRSSHLLNPADVDSLDILLSILTANKETQALQELIPRWTRRAKDDKTNALSQATASVLYEAIGDAESAQAYMQRALDLQPGNPAYRFSIARMLNLAGKKLDALQQLEIVVQQNPNNAVALHRYAWLLLQIPMVNREQQILALQLINRANQLTDYRNAMFLQAQLDAFNLLGVEQGDLELQALRNQFLQEKEKAAAKATGTPEE